MSSVGAFPGLEVNKRTTRAPVNPMDVSTIVSIYPKVVHERKVTIVPNLFHIEKGSYIKPAFLVVGPVSWWKEIDEQQPVLEIPQSSVVVADAVVMDYSRSVLEFKMNHAMPGLFFIPGKVDYPILIRDYKPLMDKARERQNNWFNSLVMLADSLWARSNGNPLAIPDDARLAAQELQLKEKPWMQDFSTQQMANCRACGYMVNPLYPVCANCKAVVNEEQAKSLGIKFAS